MKLEGQHNMSNEEEHLLPSDIILIHKKIATIEARLSRGDESLTALPKLVEEIKKLSRDVTSLKNGVAETKDIVAAWGNIKGFGHAMKFISSVLKTIALMCTAAGVIWAMFHHHQEVAQELAKTIKGE